MGAPGCRGQVDQEEIDIDARDEIGEIAQAFSEVTSKFREAQANVIEQQRLQKELQVARNSANVAAQRFPLMWSDTTLPVLPIR